MTLVTEDTIRNNASVIDFNSAVVELSRLSSQEFTSLLDTESLTVQVVAGNGSSVQIDMEIFAQTLPLHLLAVLVSSGRSCKQLKYFLQGVRLLHLLCDFATRHTRLEQILLDDVKLTEQILDIVFYILVILAGYEQESSLSSSLPHLHSALVACSFHLLTGYVSSQWQDLIYVLLVHPKVDMFIDVSFDAVRVAITFLKIKLSALNDGISSSKYSLSAVENTACLLCQQCEASLQFLQLLFQQKPFRERFLKNKNLSKDGGILFLTQCILKFNIPLHFKESLKIFATISRMTSRILSILVLLCETESFSYLDEVARTYRGMHLALSVGNEVLGLLSSAFRGNSLHFGYALLNPYPKGLLLLNSMRLADIFSDDSNFRFFILSNITPILIDILSLPHEDFVSGWCSKDLLLVEEDATLEYDPFVASGWALALEMENEDPREVAFVLHRISAIPNSQQRTSFLVKIIANLHCFVPNICEEQEKDQFINKILECLQIKSNEASSRSFFNCDAQMASKVCKNLCSLLEYAITLIPRFLNDDDVQLLSVFLERLLELAPQSEDVLLDPDIKNRGKLQDDLASPCVGRQEHPKTSDPSIGETPGY